MREDIPHPDKRTSLRVVLYIPEDSPEVEKGFASLSLFTPRRFAGWFGTDGRSTPLSQRLRLLVWVIKKRGSIKILTRRRELASGYVVKKNIRRRCHKRLTYSSPRDILYMLKGDEVFIRDLWGLLTTFRASEVCGFLWISPPSSPMFSLVALQHRLPKRNNITEGWHPPPSVI